MTKEKLFDMRWNYVWAILDFNINNTPITASEMGDQLYEWAGKNDR